MLESFLSILLLLAVGFSFLTALSNRLGLLQEKDYLRGRIFAQPELLLPRNFEYSLIVSLALLAISQFRAFSSLEAFLLMVSIVCTLPSVLSQLKAILNRQFKRPQITIRILLNVFWIGAKLLFTIVLTMLLFKQTFIVSLTANLMLYTLLMLAVVLASNEVIKQIVFQGHRVQLRRAAKILASNPELVSIGITGSYGKSTTKLFLNTLLQQKHQIVSTSGSINTDVGLAQSINSQLGKKSPQELSLVKYAVLEMDAYVVGTIARITRYFPLDIALITSINEQHLETFDGDINNTIKGNYQIFEGLKPGGMRIGVFNLDNEHCRKMADTFKEANSLEKTYTYGTTPPNGQTLDCTATDIQTLHEPLKASISFNLQFSSRLGGEQIAINLPVPAKFNAGNFAGAALVAKLTGMSAADIQAAATKAVLRDKNLNIWNTKSGIEVIDDSFSANPAGVEANISLLAERNSQLPRFSVFLTPGLEDLAQESGRIHSDLATKAAKTANKVIITTKHGEDISLEVMSNNQNISILSQADACIAALDEILGSHKPENIRIFISGRISATIYNYLKNL